MTRWENFRWAAVGVLGRRVLAAWLGSCRIKTSGLEAYEKARKAGQPVIFLIWHGRLLIVPTFFRNRGIAALVSPSRDGEILVRIGKKWGYRLVRGSGSHSVVRAWARDEGGAEARRRADHHPRRSAGARPEAQARSAQAGAGHRRPSRSVLFFRLEEAFSRELGQVSSRVSVFKNRRGLREAVRRPARGRRGGAQQTGARCRAGAHRPRRRSRRPLERGRRGRFRAADGRRARPRDYSAGAVFVL